MSRVDHLYARVERPRELFVTLTERLGLPRSYGYSRVPGFEGGAVSLGNVLFLEVLRYAPGRAVPMPKNPGLDGLALASPLGIHAAATELSRRGIPHAPVVPFAGDPRSFAFGHALVEGGLNERPGRLWSTVVLGGFLGDRQRARLFRLIPSSGGSRVALALGRLQGRLLTSERFGDVAMARSMTSDPTVWIQQFDAADMKAANAAAASELAAFGGGALTLERVKEVILGARDFGRERRRWQRLLDPSEPRADGGWHFDEGPALRLTADRSDRIVGLVCEVASLEAAGKVLSQEGLGGEAEDGALRLDRARLQGLEIKLVQATRPARDLPATASDRDTTA